MSRMRFFAPKHFYCTSILSLFVFLGASFQIAHADELISASYRIIDPVVSPSGFGTSSSYQLWSSLTETSAATSSSASNQISPGFLAFPSVTAPTAGVTAGDGAAVVSWSAASGYLGWIVTSYSVGQATVSGGPYTYTNVGSGLSSSRGGLTNGVPYYFVVRANDAFGNGIALSNEVTATPVAAPAPPVTGGGGGGGGGSVGIAPVSSGTDSAVFKGLAYPGSIVTLLKNGVIAAEVHAGANGTFEIRLSTLRPGTYSFGILAEDSQRLKSTLDLYTVYIASGVSTLVDGIFFPPTMTTDKSEVKRGDPISLLGTAAPNADVTVLVHSDTQLTKKVKSNSMGAWFYKLDSLELELGQHEAKGRAATEDDLSLFSTPLTFIVGTVNRLREAVSSAVPKQRNCDLTGDNRVNLLDFSILAYWYKRAGFPVKVDLTNDGRVDLSDVSILAYCWTG